MACALAGSKCADCGTYIPSYSEGTGRSTPPFNTEWDDGRWFDGRYICQKCYEKLSRERNKEVSKLMEKRYPGNTEKDKINRVCRGVLHLLGSRYDGMCYKEWKEKIEKEIEEMGK